jgi:hypothetical protein
MTILVVSRLSATHVSVMLRAIEGLEPPCRQIVQDENALWTLLYVTYTSESVMRDALNQLQEIAERDMSGWPAYAPPIVLSWKESTNLFLQLMVTSSGSSDRMEFNQHQTLQAFCKENLMPLQEIEEEHQGRSLLVNFIDFDTAMYFVRLSNAGDFTIAGVKAYLRPQKIMLCLLKLLSEMRVAGLTSVGLSEIQQVGAPLGMQITEDTWRNLLRCVPSIFTPQGILRKKSGTSPETVQNFRSLKLFKMPRIMFLRNKIVGMLQILCMLELKLSEDRGRVDSPPVQYSSPVFAYANMKILLQKLCSAEMRAVTINIVSTFHAMQQTPQTSDYIEILAEENLITWHKTLSRDYHDVFTNKNSNLCFALQALNNCMNIITWNSYISEQCFHILDTLIHQSTFVIADITQKLP